VLDETGEVLLEQKLATTPKAMKEVFGGTPRSRIALETGMHSPWVSRLLSEFGHEEVSLPATQRRPTADSSAILSAEFNLSWCSVRIMSNTLPLVALLALSSIASAQSSGAIAPSPPPSPEIKRLVDALSGTWSITLKIEPNESLPKGGGGKGEEVWRPGPGGLSLIEDYHSTGDEGESSGLGVAWWDNNAQRYQVTWCDGGNPDGCVVIKHGAKWEGSKVVAMDEWQKNGKKVTLKEVFSDITPTSFKQTLYQGESGGELKMFMSILAAKVR
jgi:hypothetical protein